MILTTVRPFNFQCTYRGYRLQEAPLNPDAVEKIWEDPIIINCAVNNNALGELTLYTDALLQNDGIIARLGHRTIRSERDGGGFLYPIGIVGAIWRIYEGQPLTDAWGVKNRYRYRCILISPEKGSVTDTPPDQSSTPSFWTPLE